MLPRKPRVQHLSQPTKPSTMLTQPHLSPTTMPCSMLPNQPFSSPLQMPPLTGATHLQQPPWSSGTPLMLSPSPLRTKKTTLKSPHHLQPPQALHICEPYLNTAKTSIRTARHFIPSPSHKLHLPRKHPPLLDQDPTTPPWRNGCLPWPMQMAWLSILTSGKFMAEIANHQ